MSSAIQAEPSTLPSPSETALEVRFRLLEPWRRLTDPAYFGMENVPDSGPAVLVGNHTLYGVQDAPLMVAELRARKGILVRALGDHAHFKIPVWGDLLKAFGTVDGTRANCRRLLGAGEVVLVCLRNRPTIPTRSRMAAAGNTQ